MDTQQDKRLAILIDGDNMPYSNIRGMMGNMQKADRTFWHIWFCRYTKPTLKTKRA